MRAKFLADANFDLIILTAAKRREPAVDFQTASAADLTGMEDPAVLAVAAREGRVLLTHDVRTMPQHFAAFLREHTSAGGHAQVSTTAIHAEALGQEEQEIAARMWT